MKICLLAPAKSIHTQRIARSLSHNGHCVSVLTFHPAPIGQIEVLTIKPSLPGFGKLNYLLGSAGIKSMLNRLQPDILHAHYMSSYGFAAGLIGFRPYVLSVWGTDIFAFPKTFPGAKILTRSLLNRPNLVMSTSRIMAEEARKYTKNKVIVTPFGIDCKHFSPSQIQPHDGEIIIGMVKALEPQYGHEYLLKAFRIVLDRLPHLNIKLELVGKGSLREKFRKLAKSLGISSNVEFTGFLPNHSLPDKYRRFTIAVFPSVVQESFGVALLEAQACGVPVVATKVGGFPEVVDDGKTGLLVPARDAAALAQAIVDIITDSRLRHQMSVNARQFVCQNYPWESTIRIFENAYSELISAKCAG